MTTSHPGCRIARWRPKIGGAEVTVLPAEPQDTRFIRTLVAILGKARRGEVRSYAMVFRVDLGGNRMQWIECADVEDSGDLTMLFGGIERMKDNLTERTQDEWGGPELLA